MDIKTKIERSIPLEKIIGNEEQKTLFFKIENEIVIPGQFFMLNYKGCQKPFSVSFYDSILIGFTIEDRGECSAKMIRAEKGEYFGLTGPLGKGFQIDKHERFLLIGGGIGAAPLNYLALFLVGNSKDVDVLFGAKTSEKLDYCKPLMGIASCNMSIYTDDGSEGQKGFVTKDIEKVIKEKKYDTVCICGPEIMMEKTVKMINNKVKNIQISMERYMKCGVGICGSCVIDNVGLRVCEDGPVFSYHDILKNTKEFGNYHRNENGIIEKF